MKSFGARTLTVMVGALLLVLAVGMYMGGKRFTAQTTSRQWVLHTYQVLSRLERLLFSLKSVEVNQRNFILLGDDDSLKACDVFSRESENQIKQLNGMVEDNSEQVTKLALLQKNVDKMLARVQDTLNTRRTKGLEAAKNMLLSDTGGSGKLSAVETTANEMSSIEQRLLQERLAALNKNTDETQEHINFVNVLFGASLLLIIWTYSASREKVQKSLSLQHAISRLLNESEDLYQAINKIEQLVIKHGGWSYAATWLLSESENESALHCFDVFSEPWLKESEFVEEAKSRRFIKGEGLPGQVWEKQEAVSIVNLTKDSNFLRMRLAKACGLISGFAFPIISEKNFLGALEVFSDSKQSLDEDAVTTFESIGREIGRLIEKQRAQMRFRAIFNQTFGFIGILDLEGNLLDVNEAALKFAGIEASDVVHKPFWLGPWWTDAPAQQEQLKDAIRRAASGEFMRFEASHPAPDGTSIYVDFSLKPVFDIDGKVQYLIPEGRDITESKQAERRVSEFYSTVSHELRTPLTSIRGSLGLMEGGLTGAIPEKTLKMVKIARSECDRLIRLINDILDLQKIEAGMIELKRADVETGKLVERTIDGLIGMAHTLDISLVANNQSAGIIHCDQDRIIQVLTNLVSNAIKFSPSGSDVVVGVERTADNSLKFSVKDNGPGIPPEQAHKLFARFQQLDQSDSRQKGGTGLGLAITKAIVEEHNGQIGVDSEVGKGSTFWFTLPDVSQLDPVGENVGQMPAIHVRPALIIEDDDGIAEILKSHLLQDGFEVIRASTVKEAGSLLERYSPLVILLDLTLPDGDGLDLLTSLSSDDRRKHIPVVIVTGRDAAGSIRCGHPALIDWVEKPIDEIKLHEALNAARKKIGPARVLIVEDDVAAREILSQQLSSLGVSCLEAKDGAEAIKAFRDSNPDLIILDLSIPPPDGFAVIDILKLEPNGHKPLIVYSAMDLNNEQKRLLKLGLTAHLTKSINSIDQVISKVREFLDGPVPPS